MCIRDRRAHGDKESCNERLEFLGDSVLSLIVSDYIFSVYPDMPEGELSKVRAGTICEKALAEFARNIKLGDYLFLGRGEELTNGRKRPSILDVYKRQPRNHNPKCECSRH